MSVYDLPIFSVLYGLDWIASAPPIVRLLTGVVGPEKWCAPAAAPMASRRAAAVSSAASEPRDAGLVLITLRASEEVGAPSFAAANAEIDVDMVAVASMIIKRRSGHFDPATFRDRRRCAN